MAALGSFLVFSLCILGVFHMGTSLDTLSSQDSSFCHGGLEVIYPELDIDQCLIVPKVQTLSKVPQAPQVHFPGALKEKTYVLVMVDPDAPRRNSPTSAFWRHWLVVDIQGDALQSRQIQGTTLTDYHPPTPPPMTGYHRYQFMLFEQPPGASVSLTSQEMSSRGKWDLEAFIARNHLGEPVAALQFLTQNYND